MTESQLTYWAFLSHSQEDNCETRPDAPDEGRLCWGDWLHAELKAFAIPAALVGQINARGEVISERIDPVFQDQEEQPGNAGLSERVRQALDQSKCLIVICSPRSAKSLQVNEQVRYFKQLGRGNRILPLVIAGEPNASEGHKPGRSPEDECFVPALRHPVAADGTIDPSRRDRHSLFADARQGEARQEIRAKDGPNGGIELEIAKVQLIAGLIGVGFNGLWDHEQRRRFAEARILAREALGQLEAARRQVREAQHQVLEVQNLPQDIKRQIEEVQNQLQDAQDQARTAQTQAAEARQQAQDLEHKFLESQNQVRQAQTRAQETENQARQTQDQLAAAQSRAQAAEAQVLEAQQQAREAQNQLEEARQQVRAAQNQVLEVQNLPQDIKRQIEEVQNQLQDAQDQARTAQTQAAEARQQTQELETKILESQNQVNQAQSRAQETENQARQTQDQLAAAQSRAAAAETKVLEAQEQARATQNQLEAACQQVREAQNQVLEAQNLQLDVKRQIEEVQKKLQEAQDQARNAQTQAAETRQQARDLENKFQESQNQVHQAHSRAQEIENQARQTQSQLAEAQSRAAAAETKVLDAQKKIRQIESENHAAQSRIQELQRQALEVQARVGTTQNQVLELQGQTLAARRRTRVLALTTVLALMAAGTAVWPRKQAGPAPAKTAPPEATEPGLAIGPLNREQIQQALRNAGSGGWDEHRRRSLDELAVRIPADEISNTLGAASAILAEPQRSHFQALVLDGWMKTNLPAAFDWSGQLTDTNSRQRALAQLIPALVADSPTNTLARLNDLKPVPGDQTYRLLFQHWAATDPVPALEQRQQIPGHDADAQILTVILTVWVDQQPAAALHWLESQPDSESLPAGTWRNVMIAAWFDVWAAKDPEAATTACQQLPDGLVKEKAWEVVLSKRIVKAPAAAAESVQNLPPGDYRQKAIAELCRHWADTDAPAALAWVPSLPAEAERMAATNEVIASWAGKDPQAAAQFAGQHPELSGAALGELASAWSRLDLSATTNWVASLPDGEKKDMVLLALAGATTDRAPRLAANLCTLLTTNQPTTEQLQGIATSLAGVDLAGAVEWARSLKPEATRLGALSALAEPWAQSDPRGLAAYALGLPAGETQRQLLTVACRQLARRDLPGLVELLTPLSDGGLRQSILEAAGRDCGLPHLDQTAKYISTLPAGGDQQAALKGLLSTWTAADPEAAANWLVAFPATNAQPEQVQSVIQAWSRSEPAAVAKWLANLPPATVSDDLIGAFLEGAVVKYPEYAAQWTQSVTDETRRQNDEVRVARQWLKTDRSAALKWIERLNLPTEIKP